MKREMFTLLEFMEKLRYPLCTIEVMDTSGKTIKTFDTMDYDTFYKYQHCPISAIKSKCELTKTNNFGSSQLVASFSASIVLSIWEMDKGE